MTTFDDFWAKLEEVARTAVSATRHAADSAKTSIQIAAQEDQIKRCCTALGKLYCDAIEAGRAPEGPEFQQQLQLIRQARDKIRQYRQQCPKEEQAKASDSGAPTAQEDDFEPETTPETSP